MKKYSIEYAHIYTNQDIKKERDLEIEILGNLFLKINRKDVNLVVMVDDYSFPDPTFNYSEFKNNLENISYKIDFSIRESQLIEDCDKVLSLLRDMDLKNEIVNYIKSKKKYPCSLFVAAWYLIRLGKINSNLFKPELASENLINILPKSFEPFENKAFDIIRNTEFRGVISNIENIYFEGRKI